MSMTVPGFMDTLNGCGLALSQGVGSDFNPGWSSQEAAPLVGAPTPASELGDVWLHAMGPRLPGLTVAAQKIGKVLECWQM